MDALSFAKRFLVPDGKYRPLFETTFIDTGALVVTSNGSRWIEQIYQFRPTEDMFTVGDSVMFEGEMRTLYAVTNTTATISVENAHGLESPGHLSDLN
jgi:hypothetical protein